MLWSDEEMVAEDMGWVGWEGTTNGYDKSLYRSERWSGERDNEISRRQRNERNRVDVVLLAWKANVSGHKRTIISESVTEYLCIQFK